VEEMSNLIDLVPPLELCKLISKGEFEDSAFVWALRKAEPPYIGRAIGVNMGSVIDGDYCLCTREYAGKVRWEHGKDNIPCPTVPAPTTDEILAKCKDIPGVLNPTLWWQGIWKVDCAINKSEKLSEEFFDNADFDNLDLACAEDKSAATAALKLWLKLKGIEA
jgi:hypothetical protein